MINEKKIKEVLGGGKETKMSNLKTLKDFKEVECGDYLPHRCEGREFLKEELREEAKNWIKELNKTLEKACKKQTDGYYNDAELGVGGVTYTASAFGDDEAQPIIKFINQFFNLEGEKCLG